MKSTFIAAIGLLILACSAPAAHADTLITVNNSGGSYSGNTLTFNDVNGTHLVLNGSASTVTLTYSDQTVLTYPYSQTVSGLTVTGSWNGIDEWGYSYTASVHENLIQTKHSGSGRGGGYKTYITTSVGSGTIVYDYAGAYAPPLIAPTVSWTATSSSITLTWTKASGGVAPYSYSVLDQSGVDVLDTTSLTASFAGLAPASSYVYTILTTDNAGRVVASVPTYAYTDNPTLDTVYTYNANSNTVSVMWSPAPNAVSYSVFYYDSNLGMWVDGADTTGNSATISGWSPQVYITFYIAAFDPNGVETDYDEQVVTVTVTEPSPPDGSDD